MGKSSKNDNKSKKKHKHKERKEKKKKSKKLKKHSKEKSRKRDEEKTVTAASCDAVEHEDKSNEDFAIPVELMNNKSHAPETPEEYQERQKRIRREVDPVTGRARLIKGDGEVLEEIVSKERHRSINKEATKGDGDFFQENTVGKQY